MRPKTCRLSQKSPLSKVWCFLITSFQSLGLCFWIPQDQIVYHLDIHTHACAHVHTPTHLIFLWLGEKITWLKSEIHVDSLKVSVLSRRKQFFLSYGFIVDQWGFFLLFTGLNFTLFPLAGNSEEKHFLKLGIVLKFKFDHLKSLKLLFFQLPSSFYLPDPLRIA